MEKYTSPVPVFLPVGDGDLHAHSPRGGGTGVEHELPVCAGGDDDLVAVLRDRRHQCHRIAVWILETAECVRRVRGTLLHVVFGRRVGLLGSVIGGRAGQRDRHLGR